MFCEACGKDRGRRVRCEDPDGRARMLCAQCRAIWTADQDRPGGGSVLDGLAVTSGKLVAALDASEERRRQLVLPFRAGGGR